MVVLHVTFTCCFDVACFLTCCFNVLQTTCVRCFITHYILSFMCSLYKLYFGSIEVRVLRLNLFLCSAAILSSLQWCIVECVEGKDVTSVNVKVTLKGFKAIDDLLEEERVSMLLMHVAIIPQCATAELLATYS